MLIKKERFIFVSIRKWCKNLLNYGKELRKIRNERGLRQVDVAKATGMSGFSYSSIERGRFLPNSPNVLKLLNSRFYTPEEKQKLKNVHEISTLNFHKKQNDKEHQKKMKEIKDYQSSKRRKERKEERLIKKIPDFYEKLDNLGDISKLDINDKRVQDLREKLTGTRYWKGED